MPDISQNYAADKVGHEENGAKEVRAADALGKQQSDGIGKKINKNNGGKGEKSREPQRVDKGRVAPNLHIVANTYKLRVADGRKLTKG